MPIHGWTRATSGAFHPFHQDWTVEISRSLNCGLLPDGYSALPESRALGWEPDVIAIHDETDDSGSVAVAVAAPKAKLVRKAESVAASYARRANRITVRNAHGVVVAVIEIVSPGNKDSKNAIETFVSKAVDFLQHGVNLLIVDLFPPTIRDPLGLHEAIWSELTDEPFDARPDGKPLTVASYHASPDLTAYVDPIAVGDELPESPLFLSRDRHVNVPLEATYRTSWSVSPPAIRRGVESSVTSR